ncbi:hypothetical protein J7337_001877 [Fusarium musae]|uniref:Uncharacterized protein n=1 Tax=Fusarium musae TaxID=1042133 RepID=A0A9P8IWT4_9HYPO|nr:hypothetical protein J7337_001877 [Fusarium musae]KAG9508313.1 hypothetical protein J7337_001877 [Fusarium musae]
MLMPRPKPKVALGGYSVLLDAVDAVDAVDDGSEVGHLHLSKVYPGAVDAEDAENLVVK